VEEFPAFSAGDNAWTVACDGQVLMVKGMARQVRSPGALAVNSCVPLLALTHAHLERLGQDAKLTIRVWDGESHYIGVIHGGSPEVIGGLQGIVREVARINASWPLSSARAAAARSAIPPGYLRDEFLVGPQGKEEFWSPLSDFPWMWVEQWRESAVANRWPLAGAGVIDAQGSKVLLLLEDSIVGMNRDTQVTVIPFDDLQLPEIIVGDAPPPSHDTLDRTGSLGVRITSTRGDEFNMVDVSGVDRLSSLFRYVLMRWAEKEALLVANPADAIAAAASELAEGRLPAVAYAALVDAMVAHASGVSLSREYPPRERDYLRRPAAAQPTQTRQAPATTRPSASAPSRSGINTRQVAAGAVAGATIWNLFSG